MRFAFAPANRIMNNKGKGKPDDAAKPSSTKRNTRGQAKGRGKVRAAQDGQQGNPPQEVQAPKRAANALPRVSGGKGGAGGAAGGDGGEVGGAGSQ